MARNKYTIDKNSTNWLKPEECDLLYKKYRKNGLGSEDASLTLNKVKTHLRKIVDDMKAKKVNKETIDQKFREEFEKLCQMAEVGQIVK